ncbi:tetratricopeptide repeat protein 28-like [Centruroides sculpturatus]|uniref:tetratricopeptide repeat protein 28-like n=1 Tax=Centruroides sculpturatus TaxID=218467 RepID=UPI000C6D7E6D|nr:tetratricopeptide repeat protein 28-like [Centruroides sculpturatus]XP_023223519.1 tetratricopeptide repeat protein 28-like [Centruroides sculpturatus]XP_023223520.1 tetratricopeptide repeat protein 28-like [Centruroides sculpturatus]
MEFLEIDNNESLKENAMKLLNSFDEMSEKLKNDANGKIQCEKAMKTGSYSEIVQFVKQLIRCNLPLCANMLDQLLPTINNPLQYLELLSLRMKVAMSLENFIKARELADKQYKIFKDILEDEMKNESMLPGYLYKAWFRCCSDNFQICRYQGRLDDAKKFLDEAIKISSENNNKEDYYTTRVYEADWLLAIGLLNKAIDEILLPILENHEISDEIRGFLLQKLGNACRSAAQWGKAKEYLKNSIRIAQKLNDEIAEYDRSTDLGNVYRSEGRIADAIYMQSRHMCFAFERGDMWGLSIACFNLGFSYYSVRPKPELNKALVLLTLKYILSKRMDNEPLRGMALNNIGKTLCELNQHVIAVDVLKSCVEIAKTTGNVAGEGMALSNLGTVYRFLDKYEDAIKHHLSYYTNADSRGDDGGKAITQRELALDYMLKGDLENAEKYIKEAILTLEDIRIKIGQEDSSKLANFDKNQAESYNFLQIILVKRGKFKEALALSEFARGRALSDIIRNKNKEFKKSLNTWLWDDDIILKTKLDSELVISIIDDFYKKADELKSTFLVYSIVNDRNQLHKIQRWIYCWVVKCKDDLRSNEERITFNRYLLEDKLAQNKLIDDPKFFSSLCRSFGDVSISDDFQKNEKKEIIHDKNSIIVNFPESEDAIKFRDLLSSIGFLNLEDSKDTTNEENTRCAERNIKDEKEKVDIEENMPRISLRGNWEDEGIQQLKFLYDICIGPVEHLLPDFRSEKRITRLIIIPHEYLFSVPFCALRNSKGTFFIERFCISYAHSLRTLIMLHQRLNLLKEKQENRPLKIFSVGNPKLASGKFSKLTFASKEALEVQRIFGKENCKVALEEDATKNLVIKMLQEVDIVHLATHAYPEDPKAYEEELSVKSGDYLMRGFIALTPSGPECNGLLLASDIQKLPKCECQLVTLSCCETGLGKVTGDGIVGLYRAFIAAGSVGVIVTLWKIRDDFTPIFMEKYYLTYKENGDVAMSLRSAMLFCLKEMKVNPSQWAAFSYIGPS